MVTVDRDLLVIPNLAIHMNREVNDGYKYNVQKDMLPLFSDKEGKGRFMETVAEAAEVKKEDILGHDLFLYDWMTCSVHFLLWKDSCREIVKKAFLYIVCWIMKKWEAVQDRALLLLS